MSRHTFSAVYRRTLGPFAVLFVLLTLCGLVQLSAAENAPPLKVLFLGDRGHHQPADRAAQLIPVLSQRGIEITYSEKATDLNSKVLSGYDALVIYANTEKIEPDQEQALIDYVARGGGFVPLHCASYCFLNSPAYIALVGGQFQRHGTGEFDTKVVDAKHPIMQGLTPFRTTDETYVHHKHNPTDRQVLQVRAEGGAEEPWTWVRTHGKGRVFYTAYGHDAETWSNPGFHALVERGIRWATAKGDVFDSNPKPRTDVKPFEYTKADLPNYLPGKKWGAQGDPITVMQQPLSPAESLKHLQVPRGLEPQLVAAEPDIAKPISMAWDERGRLWIAETIDYPNNKLPPGKGNDRIKICEDTDGDGRADKFTVFADKLSIPTSLIIARGGLIVHQAPETLFLKDTNGDDKADVQEVLFSGWNVNDTHAGPSSMHWGLDNWIYGMVGYAGFRGTVGGETHQFSSGFYRFRPDGSKLEFLRSTNNNSWGIGLSEEGLLFGSTANGNPVCFMPVANRYYEGVRGWSASVLGNTAESDRFYAVTEKVRQVDHFNRYTAAAGHALYTARNYPKEYWNRTAFVSDGTGHLTAAFLLRPRGSDFVAYSGWNLVASTDEWTSPILAEVGPDGQVWVIDWYNYIIQHNPTPQGFENGKGNAYVTPLRDKTHGRIYRIVNRQAKPAAASFAIKQLKADKPIELVAALASDNMFWRLAAQRLLIERGNKDVAKLLLPLVQDTEVDSLGLNAPATHALWTLHGLGLLDGSQPQITAVAIEALKHPAAGVRRNAVQVLPKQKQSAAAIVAAGLMNDANPQVRLAAILALVDLPVDEKTPAALIAAATDAGNLADRWLPDAMTAAAAAHDAPFLTALATSKTKLKLSAPAAAIATRVAEHYARTRPLDTLGTLVASLGTASPSVTDATLSGISKGWPKDAQPKLDDTAQEALVKLLPTLSPQSKGQLINLATRWQLKQFEQYAGEIAAGFLATVQDEKQPADARLAAARQLVEFRKSDEAVAAQLLELITPRTAPELSTGLIDAIGASDSAAAGTALVERLPSLTPALRPVVLKSLMRRGEWTLALVEGLEQGKLQLADLSLDQKQVLAAHPTKEVAERAKKILASGGGLPNADRQKVIEELSPQVLVPSDATAGKAVFKTQCAKCHMHSGEGNKIGPDLTGMAVHPKKELMVHILDPSRSVEGNFRQYSAVTDDGQVLSGLLVSETKTAIELVDAENKKHTILRENLEELIASTKSLMPEGFEKQVKPVDLANLLEFLTQRGKYLPLDLRTVATVVSTKGMFYDEASQAERLIFADWSPKSFDGVPFQLVDPQGDRVNNAVMLYGPQGKLPPKMPKSITLPCHSSAKAIHLLGGVSGWGFAGGQGEHTVSMIVRLHYADGQTEDHELKNGVHLADYIRQVDVPESKLAFKLRGQQLRYLAVLPKRAEPIDTIELVKGPDATAPVVMAVTLESPN